MTEANKKAFEDNRHHYLTLKNAGYLRGLNQHEKNNLLKAAREEFYGDKYSPDMWCAPCLVDFINGIYRQYDEWVKNNPVIEISQPVSANFPSHKKF